jgi:hypothetical protein
MDKNQTGIENRRFRVHHVVEALLDPQYWLLFILTIVVCISPPTPGHNGIADMDG